MKRIIIAFVAISSFMGIANSSESAVDEPKAHQRKESYTQPHKLLDQIFNIEIIGANVPYLEKFTGPARNTYRYDDKDANQTNIYKVDECEVSVGISKGVVKSLGLEVSPKCSFSLDNFFHETNLPLVHELTFGQFESKFSNGKYVVDCVMGSCGNSFPPYTSMHWLGARAQGWLEISLSVTIDGDLDDPSSIEQFDALDKWEKAILKNESEDWIKTRQSLCSEKYNNVARESFKNVKITSITIGTNGTDLDECHAMCEC